MNKIYKYTLLLALAGAFNGCEKADVDAPRVNVGNDPIVLSSVYRSSIAETRAATNFPNNGSIGIVAATALHDTIALTDWSQYSDINNVQAVAVSEANGVYSFQWDTQKYWPFDGANLYFMAYSPISTGMDNRYLIDGQKRSLFMNLQTNMPDVMYASNNISPVAHNKTSPTVDLGMFKHALSQLTIRILPGESLSPNIKVTNLKVSTPASVANLFLPSGDDGLTVDYGNTFEDALINGEEDIVGNTITRSMLLFPKTEDVTKISIILIDKSNPSSVFSADYMISFFQSDVEGEPITLERAKNTELRITVNGTNVQDPNETVVLKGRITDWTYKGHFGIDIN